jgi:spore germination protein YaaH
MRYIIVSFIILAIILGIFVYTNRFGGENIITKLNPSLVSNDSNKSSGNYQAQKILLVPYWTLDQTENIEDFDTLAYFGIAVNEKGIDREDAGYKNLEKFKDNSANKNNYLVVRMLDSEQINKILENSSSTKNVIGESIQIALENNFTGVILDLEFNAIPFEAVVKRVTGFYKEFYSEAQKNHLEFSSLIYGDTYYRGRPYEVSEIGKNSDRIYIMAYDFHKARGNPGPNFPFDSKNKYDYDFKTMIDDFIKDVPEEKLLTVFGMFGYDWTIDDEARGKGTATPKTNYQIEAFMEKCQNDASCRIENNNETRINFESDGEKHEVWYDRPSIIQEKISYINSRGLKSVGYWANSFWNSKQ